MGGDQDRGIQNAVLFGATKFLSFEEENTRIPLVGYQEVGYGAPFADLFDGDRSGRDCLVRQKIINAPQSRAV